MKRNYCQIFIAIFVCTLLVLPIIIQSGEAVDTTTVIDEINLDLLSPSIDFNITNSGEWGTEDEDQGKGIAASYQDQIFTIGTSYSSTSVNYGVLLAKWNTTAGLIWGKTINEAGSSLVHAVTADSSFVYLIGSTPSDSGSDTLVMKVNYSGSVSWIQTLDYGEYETGKDVAIAEDGSVYVLVAPTGPLPVLAKLDRNGSLIWDRTISSSEFHNSRQLCISPDGSVYSLTSQFLTRWDGDGNIIWSIESNFHRISASPDGSIYCISNLEIAFISSCDSQSILKNPANSMNFYINISRWGQDGDELVARKIIIQNGTDVLYATAVDLDVSPEGDVYSLLSVDSQPSIILKLNAALDNDPKWSLFLNESDVTCRICSLVAVGGGLIYVDGNNQLQDDDNNLVLLRVQEQGVTTLVFTPQTMNAIILSGVVGTVVILVAVLITRSKRPL